MRCVIIDDDPLARKILTGFVKQTEGIELIAEFENAILAVNFLNSNKVDFLLLDIEMPEMTGVELIKASGNQLPQVILTTSYTDFALESYNYNVAAYLVKPINYANFLLAIQKLKQNNETTPKENQSDFLFVKKDATILKLNKKEILYIECVGDYASIFTSNAKYLLHSTMKAIMDKVSEKDFIRIHRSFIVRIDKIEEIEDDAVCINDKQIAIGKTYKQAVYKRLDILS